MTSSHPLQASDVQEATPGDFGIIIHSDGVASVPRNIFHFCRAVELTTLEQFLRYVWRFKIATHKSLEWTEEDCQRARTKAATQLTGLVNSYFLKDPEPNYSPLQAIPPALEVDIDLEGLH